MKCDHIIGFSSCCDDSWLTRWSKSGQDKYDLDERFNFCPECGEDIRNLKLKRHYRHPKWNEEMTPAMLAMNKDIMDKIINRPSPWVKMFRSTEAYDRDDSKKTVTTIIEERK